MLSLRRAVPFAAALFVLPACSGEVDPPDAPITPAAPRAPAPTPPVDEVDPTPPPPPPPPPALCAEEDLEAALGSLEGVSSLSEVACGRYVEGAARCFSFTFAQPLDHGAGSDGVGFAQRMQLVHRSCGAPTTVMDNGYELPRFLYEMEPSLAFDTNTVIVEHRFQGRSLPATSDLRWTSLSVENGAGDLHAIVTTFKKLYPGRWVSTGASKGGATAVYHRFLFPDDVDGTIAYVAPASLARKDPRYQTRLGTSVYPATCAANVRAFQTGALGRRRPAFVALFRDAYGVPEDAANYYLEGYMASFDWGFWQYGEDCAAVPAPTASDATHVAYLRGVLARQTGPRLAPAPSAAELSYAALAYEWSWQQGFAAQVGAHVTPLLQTTAATDGENEAIWRSVMPSVRLPAYDGSVTTRMRDWVRTSAERLVLVYGELDPWTGGAFDAPTQPSSGRFVVSGGDHGANVSELPAAERTRAMTAITAMYGAPMTARSATLAPRVRLAHDAVKLHEATALRTATALRLR